MAEPSESDVARRCLRLLRQRGFWITRIHAGLFKSLDGERFIHGPTREHQDYAAVIEPSFLLEVKRPGGRLSDVQREKILEIESLHHLKVAVVDSPDQLASWLDQHQPKTRRKL
jgi:hypothetical protein